jgi:hypothetical protein
VGIVHRKNTVITVQIIKLVHMLVVLVFHLFGNCCAPERVHRRLQFTSNIFCRQGFVCCAHRACGTPLTAKKYCDTSSLADELIRDAKHFIMPLSF